MSDQIKKLVEDFCVKVDDNHQLHDIATRAVCGIAARWHLAGNNTPLLNDVDVLIGFFEQFKDDARKVLPVSNGGFGGEDENVWRQRLSDECDIDIYEADDLPGHFGFTGCDADCYLSEEDALIAAIQQNFS